LQDHSLIRRRIREQRRALTPKQQESNSNAISKTLVCSRLFRNSNNIGVYLETDGEIAVSQLLPLIKKSGKKSHLPALRSTSQNRLWFSEFKPGDKLITNKYGIPEPDVRKQKPTSLLCLDLVLVPLVAFDTNCNRIGMGGGFYDRTFSYLNKRNVWHKPKLIGVAHELQKVSPIQTNHWDIPLDGVLTESYFYIRDVFN
jgi:5-formyltetrahydrofolate cyclo-ligase